MPSRSLIFPTAELEVVFAGGGAVVVGVEVDIGSELVAIPAGEGELVEPHTILEPVARQEPSANSTLRKPLAAERLTTCGKLSSAWPNGAIVIEHRNSLDCISDIPGALFKYFGRYETAEVVVAGGAKAVIGC